MVKLGKLRGTQHATAQARTTLPIPASPPKMRSDLAALEMLPYDMKQVIMGYLNDADRNNLSLASQRMHHAKRKFDDPRKKVADKVNGVLAKDHRARAIKDLVDIGLLPRKAADVHFDQTQRDVLLSDNVIKALYLNKLAGVMVDLKAFTNVPSARLPHVSETGIANFDTDDSRRTFLSRENRGRITLNDGTEGSPMAEFIKSKVFANALFNEETSLFEESASRLKSPDAFNPQTLLDEDAALLAQWARDLHPRLYQLERRSPFGQNRYQDPLGFQGFSIRFAAVVTHKEIVKAMLKEGVDFNVIKGDGKTPLMYASMHAHPHMREIMSTLLAHYAEKDRGNGSAKAVLDAYVNRPDNCGMTALHWAVDTNDVERVKILIEHGADVNVQTTDGRNVLHRILSMVGWRQGEIADSRQAMIQCLLGAKIDLSQKDDRGLRAVDLVRHASLGMVIPQNIRELIEHATHVQKQAAPGHRRGYCVVS